MVTAWHNWRPPRVAAGAAMLLVCLLLSACSKPAPTPAAARAEAQKAMARQAPQLYDADGQQLVTQETGALEEGDRHDPHKVLAFLDQWKPVQ